MILTGKEQEKVAKNIGLIHKVIQDKLQPPYQVGMYSYEDLFQIGSIGLCKAAATDKGGTFSTYAYRLIWHEICGLCYPKTGEGDSLRCDPIYCSRTGNSGGTIGFSYGHQLYTRTGKGRGAAFHQ